MLPERLVQPLHEQLGEAKRLHAIDLREGYGEVHLPYALARKYPRAGVEWTWQYVFPSERRSIDPEDRVIRRHHLDDSVLHRALKQAARDAGIAKPVSAHVLRHSFCDPSAAKRLRHQDRAGTSGPRGRFHHHDLHPRRE